jgi:hypothetical protein
MVCHLKKSLYGLKQAARVWNIKLHNTLEKMGFKRMESDQSIYVYSRDGVQIILPVFVDDITFTSASTSKIDSAIQELSTHFKLLYRNFHFTSKIHQSRFSHTFLHRLNPKFEHSILLSITYLLTKIQLPHLDFSP